MVANFMVCAFSFSYGFSFGVHCYCDLSYTCSMVSTENLLFWLLSYPFDLKPSFGDHWLVVGSAHQFHLFYACDLGQSVNHLQHLYFSSHESCERFFSFVEVLSDTLWLLWWLLSSCRRFNACMHTYTPCQLRSEDRLDFGIQNGFNPVNS